MKNILIKKTILFSLNKRPKIFYFLLFFCFLSSIVYGQTPEEKREVITLKLEKASLFTLFEEIEKQSNYIFFFLEKSIDPKIQVSINVTDKSVREVLNIALSSTNLTFLISDKQVTIKEKEKNNNQQEKRATIKGRVVDVSGAPLPGVSILVKGTNSGTISDLNGDYQILVDSSGQIIQFSYIGYTPREIEARNNNQLLQVVLNEDTYQLEEMIIIGYSTRTREKLISSVSTISNDQLVKSNVPNLENALSGRVSGVFSRQSTGEPGNDGGDIKIRGFGSALVVVDGIPGRSYDNLDPAEIESISVLKDASAAAVYGMQGANGVILVTTKRGNKNKKAVLDISTRYGMQVPHNYPEAASANLWQRLVRQYYANEKLISNPGAIITPQEMEMIPYAYNTNWYNEIIKNAPISQSNISISGGSEKINYFVLAGFLYQDGIWSTNSTKKNRFNFRNNLDVELTENFKMSVSIGGIINNLDYSAYGSDVIAGRLKTTAPNFPVRWEEYPNGYAFGGEGTDNPVALADKETAGYRTSQTRNLNVDYALEYRFSMLEGLSAKANFGYTQIDGWSKNWTKNISYIGYRENVDEYYQSVSASNTNKASLTLGDNTYWGIVGQGFLNYKNGFYNHNINSGLVFEVNQAKSRWFNTSRGEFPSTALDMLAGGNNSKLLSNGESLREYRSASLIGRFSYDYKSIYFLDFNFRYDGAQYFAKKWGFFPSFSAGWLVTNQDFMKNLTPIISELKFRASWGELGDLSSAKSRYDNEEQYYFQSGYLYPGATLVFGDRTLYGLTETINANPDFTWAKSSMMNAGTDFKLWKGIISGSLDFFQRYRSGLPAIKANDNAGALATYYNLNNDNTRGFEMTLNHNRKVADFSYYVDANFSWARTKYGGLEHGQFTSGFDEWKWNNSYNWSNIRWGLNQTGQYQSYDEIAEAPMHDNSNYNTIILPGDLKYEDWNGDGYIDENDKRPIGRTSYPEIMYGLTLGGEWKGIDFSMFWQGGALANFQISAFDMAAFQEGKTFNNTWKYFEDSWYKKDYTDSDSEWVRGHFPAVRDMFTATINSQESTFWMWNGNYLRLKNIELGYTLPTRITKDLKIKSMRIYVSGYNILTFSAQKYFDPEQPESQFSFASYPQLMSFNAGVNLKF